MKKSTLILVAILVLLSVGGWYWQATSIPPAAESTETTSVALAPTSSAPTAMTNDDTTDPYARYQPLLPMQIGDQSVQASIAATAEERRQGLSNTPVLPNDVEKLFVFSTAGQWGFWMKDMNYAIDILWVNEAGRVVHIAPDVAPETYPESFTPPEPARYVIETVAGFTTRHDITVGTSVVLPEQL